MTKNEMPEFTTEVMVRFFEEFDPIKFKYGYGSVGDMQDDTKRYNKIVQYEKSNQKSMLTEKNYASDYANLNLVYDEKKQNQENIRLLELISNKVISQYINISGMERLFSETYIEFEWEMHLSADYKKHNMKFYRDHFIHQIRDAYMMMIFMQKYGFYDYVKEAFETENGSKITRFVRRSLMQQEYAEKAELKKLREKDRDFYIRNLIYMSSLMAALFHDIGYPERFYMISGRHIMDYIANLHELNAGSSNMKKIYSLLQNSLLFRIVPFREIEKRICDVDDPDHGALSAIIFLLHFYENGAIYKLAPYKTAAVELAALAIFNHTNTFGILAGEKETTAYRLCFSRNPISYLLRICDDLQEWERIYFVISSQSNPVFCQRCNTPIIGKRCGDVMRYECNCKSALGHCRTEENDETYCFSQTFEGNAGFPYRRIYNVSVCDEITVFDKQKGKLCIELHYNPYKLLHVAYLNPTYAKYRIKELNSVKKLFENQAIIPKLYLEYFVTSNPVHIKVKLLEDYFEKKKHIRLDEGMLLNAAENDGVFEGLAKQLLAECKPLIAEFVHHTKLCKECAYCENFVHSISKIFHEKETGSFYGCQNEVDRRCLAYLITCSEDVASVDADRMKALLPSEHNVAKLIKEKALSYPDFKKTMEMADKEQRSSIFFSDIFETAENNLANLQRVCPIKQMTVYLETALMFYVKLYLCQAISRITNMPDERDVREAVKQRGREMSQQYKEYPELQCLIEDCFLQFSRMYQDISEFDFYPEEYYKQYANGKRKQYLYAHSANDAKLYERESEDYYYKALARYMAPQLYRPVLARADRNYIDAYTDLYLFQMMNEAL